jgi:hypothetical protein
MRCYICDAETDWLDPRDRKPICQDCQEEIREVAEYWAEKDANSPDVPKLPS